MQSDVEAVGIGRNAAAGIGEAVRVYECGEILGPGGDEVAKWEARRAEAVNIPVAERADSWKVDKACLKVSQGDGCAAKAARRPLVLNTVEIYRLVQGEKGVDLPIQCGVHSNRCTGDGRKEKSRPTLRRPPSELE